MPGKYEHPYDIPRDHHNRSLYDIPKNKPAVISVSSNNETISTSEIATSVPPLEYQQPYSPSGKNAPVLVPNESHYLIPSGLKAKPEAKARVISTVDDPLYVYMDNNSETTDGDEELGGNHDKTSSEVNINTWHCYGKCGFVWVVHLSIHGSAK